MESLIKEIIWNVVKENTTIEEDNKNGIDFSDFGNEVDRLAEELAEEFTNEIHKRTLEICKDY